MAANPIRTKFTAVFRENPAKMSLFLSSLLFFCEKRLLVVLCVILKWMKLQLQWYFMCESMLNKCLVRIRSYSRIYTHLASVIFLSPSWRQSETFLFVCLFAAIILLLLVHWHRWLMTFEYIHIISVDFIVFFASSAHSFTPHIM